MKTLQEILNAGWIIRKISNKWVAKHNNGHEYIAKTRKQLIDDVSWHPMFHC